MGNRPLTPPKFEEICNFEKLLWYFVNSRNFKRIFVNFPKYFWESEIIF